MSSSGGGVGVPITAPTIFEGVYDQMTELVYIPNCAVSLSRYAKIIGYNEASFWGVIVENSYTAGCGPLWSESERMNVQLALAEAQQEIEQQINYPLCPTWVAGSVQEEWLHNDRWVDQQPYCSIRIATRYPRLIQAGIRATTVLAADAVITHSSLVGTVGPLATVATDASEIHVYYPGSNREIMPSSVVIASGNVTIEIPRYRLVLPDLLSGGDEVLYETIGNFLGTVDVVRIYNDPSTQAVLVRPHCSNGNCVGGCGECTQTACIYLLDPYVGLVDVVPATWDANALAWSSRVVCAGNYSRVRLNYQTGMRYLNLQAETAVVRLAHSKMGRPPCQCDKTGQIWQGDYSVPNVLTRERINCPFGLSSGAWTAWKWAMSLSSMRAGIL